MSQTDITPALTADDWARWRHPMNVNAYESLYYQEGGGVRGNHAVMALANSELPDDDPQKITREMVERMQQAATYVRSATRQEYGYDEGNWGNVPRHYIAVANGLDADAAKLAALLPPE
jgi:hypothetical protein